MRQIFVRLHRWLGLATAVFLAVAGLTGSVIAFNHELDAWLNPELFHANDHGDRISPLELAARVEALEPRLRVAYVPLEVERADTLVLGVIGRTDPTTGALYDLGYDEVFVNPVSGAWLGQRLWGACCFERKQLLPFLYSIHYSLHLPELWGLWLMGVVAAAWAIDSFVGFYLTLPPRNRAARHLPGPPARQARWGGLTGRLNRWKPAWKIKFGASRYRINFDLHRAAGLWCWTLLLMLAISAVSMNLHFEIFRPLLSRITTVTPSLFDPSLATAPVDPTVPFATIVATATQVGLERGWQPPFDVFYSAEFGLYGVGFGDHHAPGLGVPYLYFDRHGTVTGQTVPGAGTAGDTVLQAMFPLHSGQIVGLPGRIFVSFMGLVVATLSVTGVIIWARKRKGRLARRQIMAPRAVANGSTPGWRWPGRRGSTA